VERPQGIHLVCPRGAFEDPRLRTLAAWLRAQAGETAEAG